MELRLKRDRVLSLSLVSALLLLACACGSASSTASPTATVPIRTGTGNTLNWWANYGDSWADSLDPAVGTNTVAINTENLVDANLVKYSYPSLKIIGDLASTWTVSKGGRVYTFMIRANARFSNGDRVTASDAAWSLTRALAPATKSQVALTHLGHIVGADKVAAGKSRMLKGVRVINARELRITLDQPIAYFLAALAYGTGDILDKRVMQGKPPGTYLTNSCTGNVGAGPFTFVCRNRSAQRDSFYPNGQAPSMDLVPNPHFYGRKPSIKIHAPVFASAHDVFQAFKAGQMDGATLPSSDLTAARTMKGFIDATQFETDFITPNAQIAPFNNAHCRLAVAYMIDRERLAHQVLRNTSTPLYDVLPPRILGYFGRDAGVPSYDPARAKAELAQCPGGLKNVTMTLQNSSSDIVHEYDRIRADLQRIGAAVTMKPLDVNSWLRVVTQNMNVTKNQETITENLWIDDYPDPQDWLVNLLRSDAGDNIGGFRSSRYDALVDRAGVDSNVKERAKLYREAAKIALSGGYLIPVVVVNGLYVVSPRVHGLVAANGWTWPIDNDWSRVSISAS